MSRETEYTDVYKFNIVPDADICTMSERVYVKPFDIPGSDETHIDPREEIVKRKYFTKERIDKLKQELIKRIQECDNPFTIYCSDFDAYAVSTDNEIIEVSQKDCDAISNVDSWVRNVKCNVTKPVKKSALDVYRELMGHIPEEQNTLED